MILESKKSLLDSPHWNRAIFDFEYGRMVDPYGCNSIDGAAVYRMQINSLDRIRGGARFHRCLEVGCGEGGFTELLGTRCESVLAVDLCSVALERARQRCRWSDHVRFGIWDLRCDSSEGSFDLIVVSEVLSYLYSRRALSAGVAKLLGSLSPGGHLLLWTVRANEAVESAWWSRWVIRGTQINAFVARHPALQVSWEEDNEFSRLTVFRKVA